MKCIMDYALKNRIVVLSQIHWKIEIQKYTTNTCIIYIFKYKPPILHAKYINVACTIFGGKCFLNK